MSEVDTRLSSMEKEVAHLKKLVEKTVKERELTLKEKFAIHDRSQGFLRWFEEITSDVSGEVVWLGSQNGLTELKKAKVEDLKKIVKGLVDLVDNALGVKFP